MIYRGLFQLPDREDIAPVYFQVVLDGAMLVACIWTEDRRLDKVARGPASEDTFNSIDQKFMEIAREWLEAEVRRLDGT